jgi:hypothetical protein
MRQFNDSIYFDVRLWEADVDGSMAYAKALARVGIITEEEARRVREADAAMGTPVETNERMEGKLKVVTRTYDTPDGRVMRVSGTGACRDREGDTVRRRTLTLLGASLLGLALPATAAAADGSAVDSGATAWLLIATGLVMIMLPGLALFYGGLVRRKNVLSTIMHSFFGLALVSVVWVLVGFSSRSPRTSTGWSLIGGLDFVGL